MRVRPRTARYTRCVESYRTHAAPGQGSGPHEGVGRDRGRAPARRRATRRRDHEETLRELDERGRRPSTQPAPGQHRHGDVEHASDHAHPHAHSGPGERPVVGIVGAGAVGTALGVALDRAGWPVGAVASRDPGASGAVPRAGHRRPRVRRAQRPGGRRRARDPRRPRRRRRASPGALRLYAGQAMIHTSGSSAPRCSRPAMAAGTQAGRVPPAGRVRGPRPGARGAARRDDRDRGRRRAGRAPRGDGRGDRGRPGAACPGLEGGLPRGGGAGGGRRRRAARHDPRGRRGRRASTRRGRSGSTCRCSSRRVANARGPRHRRVADRARRPAATPGRSRAHLAALGAQAPGALDGLPRAARARRPIAEQRGALSPDAAETAPRPHLQRDPLTRYDADMQHSIAARHAAWPARFVHPSARARERRLGLRPSSAFIAAPGPPDRAAPARTSAR